MLTSVARTDLLGCVAGEGRIRESAAGPVQVRECELAFLAGAQAMIGTLSEIAEQSTEEAGARGIDRQQTLIARRSNEILSD